MDWKYFGKVHSLLYRLSGGRFGARMGWIDVVLVEEREALWEKIVRINRHQGEYLDNTQRRIPLVYLRRV